MTAVVMRMKWSDNTETRSTVVFSSSTAAQTFYATQSKVFKELFGDREHDYQITVQKSVDASCIACGMG